MMRRVYSPEFKREAAQPVVARGCERGTGIKGFERPCKGVAQMGPRVWIKWCRFVPGRRPIAA